MEWSHATQPEIVYDMGSRRGRGSTPIENEEIMRELDIHRKENRRGIYDTVGDIVLLPFHLNYIHLSLLRVVYAKALNRS
jgi:hypothetical protein